MLADPADYQRYPGRSFSLLLIDEAGQWADPTLLDLLRSNLRGPVEFRGGADAEPLSLVRIGQNVNGLQADGVLTNDRARETTRGIRHVSSHGATLL